MARIPYFDPAKAPDATLRALDGRRQINIFRLIARADNVAPEVLELGYKLSKGSSLDPAVREVVILRVAELTGAVYQAKEHNVVAQRIGFSPEKISAIEKYPAGDFDALLSEFEQHLIDFTDEIVHSSNASDRLFNIVHEQLGDSKTVEIVLLVGFYMMIGRVMNTFEIELESKRVDTFDFSQS